MLFDTHCHIYMNKHKSVEEILSELNTNNVWKIICVWIDIETSKICVELAKKYPWVIYASIWIHPSDVKQYLWNETQTINILENILIENKKYIVWIWECWFDYHWIDKNNFNKEQKLQKDFFVRQINLAKKYSLPIIIHSRDSKDDTLNVLKELDFKKFILHCYSEDLDFAYKSIYFSEVCKISFSWILTYKSAWNIHNVAANIPLNRILIETDSPYLAPQSVRWTENNPSNLKYILQKIYELRQSNWKNETLNEIENTIYKNSLEIYSIDN